MRSAEHKIFGMLLTCKTKTTNVRVTSCEQNPVLFYICITNKLILIK